MIEQYFFFCYYAFLQGDLEKTRMYYHFLTEELKSSGSRRSLDKYYLIELKKIRGALQTGTLSRNEWVGACDVAYDSQDAQKASNQPFLVKMIFDQGSEKLREILGAQDNFHLANVEHPCDPYGKIDMYYRDGLTAYPLEVKKDQAGHDLIGQISKYELAFRLKLHIKEYKRVEPVTICASYDKFTLPQLKKKGIRTIKYSIIGNKLRLSEI